MDDPTFLTARKALLEQYQKENALFIATTRPYRSTVYFPWEIVNGTVALGVAYAVLRAGTQLEAFSYGIGDQIPVIPQVNLFKVATSSDTNQSRGRRTNGVEDFVIEGISATNASTRIRYAAADIPATATDADVNAAYAGGRALVDPAAIALVPQGGSPFNLEALLYEALKPCCSIDYAWDRRNFIPIGTLDQVPEGGAKSYLHASGSPETNNRYKVPEGYVWRRTDKPDGDFAIRMTITDSVVVPISLLTLPGGGANVIPTHLVTAVAMRVHGLGLGQPGANVG